MQTNESRKLIHTLMVNLSGMQGEARRFARSQYARQLDELCDPVHRGEQIDSKL
jgi:hypothetical protein